MKGNIFSKTLKISAFVFALALCTNSNASTTENNNLSVNTINTTSLSILSSAGSHFLTWSWWSWGSNSNCRKVPVGTYTKCYTTWYGKRKCRTYTRYILKCEPEDPPSDGGSGGSQDPPVDSVPLDGGLGILLLGATMFGVKKLRGQKK